MVDLGRSSRSRSRSTRRSKSRSPSLHPTTGTRNVISDEQRALSNVTSLITLRIPVHPTGRPYLDKTRTDGWMASEEQWCPLTFTDVDICHPPLGDSRNFIDNPPASQWCGTIFVHTPTNAANLAEAATLHCNRCHRLRWFDVGKLRLSQKLWPLPEAEPEAMARGRGGGGGD